MYMQMQRRSSACSKPKTEQAAVDNLKYFGDCYPTRRNIEANYFEAAL